uniref:Uncharacterized protein n=1 Tax=Arion vulgaris TaxID=1028688 RepID=A0A0B6ZSP2_9EUPU
MSIPPTEIHRLQDNTSQEIKMRQNQMTRKVLRNERIYFSMKNNIFMLLNVDLFLSIVYQMLHVHISLPQHILTSP